MNFKTLFYSTLISGIIAIGTGTLVKDFIFNTETYRDKTINTIIPKEVLRRSSRELGESREGQLEELTKRNLSSIARTFDKDRAPASEIGEYLRFVKQFGEGHTVFREVNNFLSTLRKTRPEDLSLIFNNSIVSLTPEHFKSEIEFRKLCPAGQSVDFQKKAKLDVDRKTKIKVDFKSLGPVLERELRELSNLGLNESAALMTTLLFNGFLKGSQNSYRLVPQISNRFYVSSDHYLTLDRDSKKCVDLSDKHSDFRYGLFYSTYPDEEILLRVLGKISGKNNLEKVFQNDELRLIAQNLLEKIQNGKYTLRGDSLIMGNSYIFKKEDFLSLEQFREICESPNSSEIQITFLDRQGDIKHTYATNPKKRDLLFSYLGRGDLGRILEFEDEDSKDIFERWHEQRGIWVSGVRGKKLALEVNDLEANLEDFLRKAPLIKGLNPDVYKEVMFRMQGFQIRDFDSKMSFDTPLKPFKRINLPSTGICQDVRYNSDGSRVVKMNYYLTPEQFLEKLN